MGEGTTIKVRNLPSMDADGRLRFTECLAKARVYLEYGSGGSSMLASRMGVPHIYSVESDAHFLAAVRIAVGAQSAEPRFVAHHVDIGPTKAWGYPEGRARIKRWPLYGSSVWERIRAEHVTPDLVLIDGRFRVACFCLTLINAKPGATVLFDDYVGREHYREAERLVVPERLHGRMAEFRVPEGVDQVLAVRILLEHVLDPR